MSRRDHRDSSQEPVREAQQKSSINISGKQIFTVLIAVLFIGSSAAFAFNFLSSPSPSGAAVASGPVHWHPLLEIVVNGQKVPIPANVGITGTSTHPGVIHTHDGTGTLHIEQQYPTVESTALGEFFKVWGKTFSSECILEFCSDGTKSVKMTVNGAPNTQYGSYPMRDGDKIVITYG